MFNVQRLLGDRIGALVDAMQPGGSGDPFSTLSLHEREELSNLYRLGFPRGDEFMISQPFGQIWLWTSIADMLIEEDDDYFSAFWSKPGYLGHDSPQLVEKDIIDSKAKVALVLTARELQENPAFATPEIHASASPPLVKATLTHRRAFPTA